MTTTARTSPIDPPRAVLLLAVVLLGLAAGFFYTYEASVTLGLAEVGDAAYVETFQAINDTIRNPAFGIVFFGVVPALGLAIALNWRAASTPARIAFLVAVAGYAATVAITAIGNVPLNDELALVVDRSPESLAAARDSFEADWNRLNLLRTLTCVGAFVALAAARHLGSVAGEVPDRELVSGQTA